MASERTRESWQFELVKPRTRPNDALLSIIIDGRPVTTLKFARNVTMMDVLCSSQLAAILTLEGGIEQ